MPNIRVISDNAIDRASLSASSTNAGFAVTNLQGTRKSDVWRGPGGARLNATWAAPETIQGVALPFCNLSPVATLRVRLTTETVVTNLLASPATFTAAAWTKTNATVSSTAVTGPDNLPSAYTLTATAANGEIKQTVTVAASAYTSSIFIRRRTGGGPVYIRNAANTAWIQPQGLSTNWTRFVNDGGTTSTSAVVDIMLGTSGDAVDIAFAQLEAGPVSSYYPGTRPLGYIDSWQSYSYDVTAPACPAPAVAVRGFTAAQAASAYAFGGGASARAWLPAPIAAYGLAIDIIDTGNLQGYVEAAFLVAGAFWEGATNVDYGASAQLIDTSKNDRNDAGDLITDVGTVSQRLSVPMSKLSPSDRATLWGILRNSGIRYPLFMSLFPGHTDLAFERDHQVFGKLVSLPAMTLPYFNVTSTTLEIESV